MKDTNFWICTRCIRLFPLTIFTKCSQLLLASKHEVLIFCEIKNPNYHYILIINNASIEVEVSGFNL